MIKYLRNWNITRLLRLIIGVLVVIQGIISSDWLFIFMGGLFSLLPLLNLGCGTSGCSYPIQKTNHYQEKNTEKEVK